MKLYTEEQVNEIFNRVKMISEEHKHEHIINHLSKDLTPIGLPSDEEIEEQTKEITSFTSGTAKTIVESYYYSGAKWMKEQILNQNKS